ncbi:hypothetical protein SLEP1_g11793 [Rubroshorea leprosula]|nr:hypothetical protein SLEP1_g11793 [Rubroshorea leprosula]
MQPTVPFMAVKFPYEKAKTGSGLTYGSVPQYDDAKLVVSHTLDEETMGKETSLHNGWPPNVPPVAEMNVGEPFTVEMVDFSGGGIMQDY